MALPVNLPGDGRILGANSVVDRTAGGGAGVHGKIGAHVAVDNHATHEVRVVVALIIDNGEHLTLNANLRLRFSEQLAVTEDAVVERRLELVERAAGAGSGVRPMHFIGLANLHVLAVLPIVFSGELGIFAVVEFALETLAGLSRQLAPFMDVGGAGTGLIKLANREVLSTKMPVHVDWAKACHPVGDGDGYGGRVEVSIVALGHVGTGLFLDCSVDTFLGWQLRICAFAGICSLRRLHRGKCGSRCRCRRRIASGEDDRRDEKPTSGKAQEDDENFQQRLSAVVRWLHR